MKRNQWMLTAMLAVLACVPVFGQAKIVTSQIKTDGFTVTLPRAVNETEAVSDQVQRVNNEVVRAVTDVLKNNDTATSATVYFQKMAENKHYLSLYYYGHVNDATEYGESIARAVVIDKKTGALVPLSQLSSITVEQLNHDLADKKLTMMAASTGKTLEFLTMWPAESLPQDYYINKEGKLVLVFPMLAMGPKSYDVVLIPVHKMSK